MAAELAGIAEAQGWEEVPEVAEALATALDRGHHLAIAAAEGSGREAVFAAAVVGTVDPDAEAAQALILTPTREAAVRVATVLWRAVARSGVRVQAIGEAETWAPGILVHCLVGRPSDLLPEVRAGRLGLDDLHLLVLDGVADLEELDEWTSTEPILDTLPAQVQKIAVTRKPGEGFEALLTRQLPRARRWPDELFGKSGGEAGRTRQETPPSRPLAFGAGASGRERLKVLETCVRRLTSRADVRVTCFGVPSAGEAAAFLAAVGLPASGPEGRVVHVSKTPDSAGEEGPAGKSPETGPVAAVVFGLPLGLPTLRTACESAVSATAIVDSAHVAQLELMARRGGWRLQPLGSVPFSDELDPVTKFRHRLRTKIQREDSDAELLVLDPLLREHGALRVAAALSALLRSGRGRTEQVAAWPDVEAASVDVVRKPGSARHRGARPAWSRIFIGAGRKDDVRPGDLVGAITGETGVAGAQIGKIEIRTGFSLVEIDSQVVDDVVRALQGTSIRGRLVPVRLDRESTR